jgi:hypothetical protein
MTKKGTKGNFELPLLVDLNLIFDQTGSILAASEK